MEVVGHRADVVVADVVAQRLQEQHKSIRVPVVRRRVDPRRVEGEELALGPRPRLSTDDELALVRNHQPKVGSKRQ